MHRSVYLNIRDEGIYVEDAHDLHQIIDTNGEDDGGHLTLNKFDYDYVLNSHYKVSAQKLCSAYISVDFKILPTCMPYLSHYT